MNYRERSVLELAKSIKRLDSACPEVGMGPSDETFVREALTKLGLQVSDVNMKIILEQL